jgi:hypothetical protein
MAIKPDLGVVVADLADGIPHDLFVVDDRAGGDLPGQQHHAGLGQGLAGDAGVRILGEDRVHHGIGDLVRHLVRMTLGNGLGSEQVTLGHGASSSDLGGGRG